MRRTTTPGIRLLAVALAIVLAAAFAACGDSEGNDDGGSARPAGADRSERQRAAATVRGMYEAFAAGDAKGVCAAMSVDARDQIANTLIGGPDETPEERSCERSFDKFADTAPASGLLERTHKIQFGDIGISGDIATVTVGLGDQWGKVALVKEDGEWRFDAAPGTPNSPGVPGE